MQLSFGDREDAVLDANIKTDDNETHQMEGLYNSNIFIIIIIILHRYSGGVCLVIYLFYFFPVQLIC